MVSMSSRMRKLWLASAAAPLFAGSPVLAQDASSQSSQQEARNSGMGGGEIIVTARKREESAIDVPVALVALGREDLERYASSDLQAISTQVPGLVVQPTPGGAGGSIALRGVSSSPSNPAIEQAVSINIDGVQVSSANILRLGQIDLMQMEVLKGPQALFFGKNSPGGIITMRTADPGDHFEVKAIAGYEFNAREKTGQLTVSGPLTDTLGARITVYGMDMKGFNRNFSPELRNPATPGEIYAFAPKSTRWPNRDEIFVRGTLLFSPSSDLDFRLKYNFNKLKGDSPYATSERIYCPYGAPQIADAAARAVEAGDCRANGVAHQGLSDPRVMAAFPQFYPYPDGLWSKQQLISLEGNYQVADDVTLTSVTGFYKLNEHFYSQANYQPVPTTNAGTHTTREDFSQELRLSTSGSDWPVNFTVGAFYQDTKFFNGIPIVSSNMLAGTFALASFNEFFQKGEAYSFFGQAMWNITPTLELSGGVRWSHEKKALRFFQTTGTPAALTRNQIAIGTPSRTFKDWSPEVSLTWKPTNRFTAFASWRNGFKSGGYNTGGGGAAGLDLTYEPEDVSGGEVGIKTAMGGLRLNATAYRYIYKRMQVSTFDPTTLRQTVINAASAKVQGLELDATYRPSGIRGLELRGAINYNHARYKKFLSGCFTGQTIELGCNLNQAGPGLPFRQQDLSGAPLILAPDWTGTAGFTYTHDVGSNLKFSIGGDASFSSSFFAQLEEQEEGRQDKYWMFNASARIGAADDAWEVALIAQNLSDVRRSRFVSQVPGTGLTARTGTALEGGFSDLSGQINRGRQVRLQLSVKFD